MVGESFEIYFIQMGKYALKLCNMVGEYFESYLPQMVKYTHG